jgi:hypothetical protein
MPPEPFELHDEKEGKKVKYSLFFLFKKSKNKEKKKNSKQGSHVLLQLGCQYSG